MKWVEDRRENLLAAGQSRHEHADGRGWPSTPTARSRRPHIDFVSDCGAYPTPWPVGTAAAVGVLFPGPYRVPARQLHAPRRCTRTPSAARAYRGPWQFESLAREVLLDIAARRMGMDPVELRRRNLLRRDELPYANPNGMTYDSISPLETFEQALDDARLRRVPRRAGRGPRRGPLPRRRPLHLRRAVDAGLRRTTRTEAATIRIEPSGTVNVYIAGGSTGNSIETTVVQLTADALGVDIDDVATIQGDTAVTGFGAGAGRAAAAGR